MHAPHGRRWMLSVNLGINVWGAFTTTALLENSAIQLARARKLFSLSLSLSFVYSNLSLLSPRLSLSIPLSPCPVKGPAAGRSLSQNKHTTPDSISPGQHLHTYFLLTALHPSLSLSPFIQLSSFTSPSVVPFSYSADFSSLSVFSHGSSSFSIFSLSFGSFSPLPLFPPFCIALSFDPLFLTHLFPRTFYPPLSSPSLFILTLSIFALSTFPSLRYLFFSNHEPPCCPLLIQHP